MTHSNNITSGNPGTNIGVIEDYNIVPQDSDNRKTWYASSDLYTNLASTRETGGDFNAFDFFLPIGGGPPLHYHTWEHEAWYGIEGELFFGFGHQPSSDPASPLPAPKYVLENVPPGMVIFGPRFRTHIYGNQDSVDAQVGENQGARTLSITTPGGLEQFFTYVSDTVPAGQRNEPLPTPQPPPPEQFKRLVEIGLRVSGAPYFVLPPEGYEPPPPGITEEEVVDYVAVLPRNPDRELVDGVLKLIDQVEAEGELDRFSIWQIGDDGDDDTIPLPIRPTFEGDFGIEYTSLLTLEETGGELEYNEFFLNTQDTNTFVQANLTGRQMVEPNESLATGIATMQLNEAGDLEYSLRVTGLDLGELAKGGTPQTPNNKLDDVTAIHIHSGERGINGSHEFNIVDPNEQDETDLTITLNEDGSTTIRGIWNQTEKESPKTLSDFLKNNGLPGEESKFYFQVHTEGNPNGEIRGQIARTTNDFPYPIQSENHQVFYVKEGQLSFKIGDEVRVAQKDDFVFIAPGNEYSIGNFGDETVNALAATITNESKDLLEVSGGKGRNRIDGGEGNDLLLAGSNEQLVGGEGEDVLRILSGGNNLLYGAPGADQFWIVNGELPDTVPEERQNEYELEEPFKFLFEGLPSLQDTRNTIEDFERGVDKIVISGLGISSFEDLRLLPAFDDLQSTSILATVEGIEGEISLANVKGIIFDELSANDFLFGQFA